MDSFVQAYLEAALWSSVQWDENGNDGRPFDDDFEIDDFDPEALKQAEQECADFRAYCESEGLSLDSLDNEQAGHDFWLTRNGHGAGFWDRGLGQLGDDLTKAAHSFGSIYLYVTDDGKVGIS